MTVPTPHNAASDDRRLDQHIVRQERADDGKDNHAQRGDVEQGVEHAIEAAWCMNGWVELIDQQQDRDDQSETEKMSRMRFAASLMRRSAVAGLNRTPGSSGIDPTGRLPDLAAEWAF